MRFNRGKIIFCIILGFGLFLGTNASYSLTVDELRVEIEKKRQEKARLEEENKKLEAQIDVANKEATTLTGAVKVLDTTQKKLQNDIKVTQSKISATELTIQKLVKEITIKEEQIDNNTLAIAETLRDIQRTEGNSMIESLLHYESVTDWWNHIETLERFQSSVSTHVEELKNLKKELQGKKVQNEGQKVSLVGLKSELSDRKTIVEQNKKAKSDLLVQTKSREALYKEQLQRNIELGRKFEQELFDFESQLRIQIDQSKLPGERSGVLAWPLDSILITQRFGKTVDSKRLYVSGTHNGVDFRATTGTAVKSVLGGIVRGVGNTDDQPGCYSYGRWVLIEHPNGLSSLYAHLSSAKVSSGQNVSGGEIIAYSGGQPGTPGAGFSTGPHLHLGLYASQGVTIKRYENSKFCKNVNIPVSPSNAYLDPLAYLPAL